MPNIISNFNKMQPVPEEPPDVEIDLETIPYDPPAPAEGVVPMEVDEEAQVLEDAPAAPVVRTFRLAAKHMYLTYPQCDTTKEDAMQAIKDHFGEDRIDYVIVGHELHEDGGNHLHIALGLKRAVNYKRSDCLDWVVGQHGNYQVTRDRVRVFTYCTKDGDFVEHGVDAMQYIRARKKHKSAKSEVVATGLAEGQTLQSLNSQFPGFFLMNLPKIKTYQSWLEQTQSPISGELSVWSNFNPLGLNPSEMQVMNWMQSNMIGRPTRAFGMEQLYIHGPTGVGKTSFVMNLTTTFRAYWTPMEENFFDAYSDKAFDFIVFDEFRGQKTIQFMNAFVQGAPKTLRIKGGQVMKRKNLPVIILSNFSPAACYRNVAESNPVVMESFVRRFKVVEVTDNLFTLLNRMTTIPAATE